MSLGFVDFSVICALVWIYMRFAENGVRVLNFQTKKKIELRLYEWISQELKRTFYRDR